MRYKCLLGAAALLVAAAGCGSDNPDVVATSGAFVAPLADFDWAYDYSLWYNGLYDPFTGVFVAQIYPGDAATTVDAGVAVDAGAVVPTRTLPRPLSGIFAAWRVLVTTSCIPSTPFVDNDQDGVPASYTATFNCPNQVVGDRTSTVTGTVSIADADDNSKNSGFTITFTNFNVTTIVGGRTRSRTVNGTAILTPVGGTFQGATNLTTVFDLTDSNGDRAQGTYAAVEQGTYTPDASAGVDLFASGTVNLLGTGMLSRVVNGVTQTRTVTRQTNPQLHWNRGCKAQNADSLGYDAGTLLYQDNQGSELQMQFNGCGNPKITTK
jgi:hypothetical protein